MLTDIHLALQRELAQRDDLPPEVIAAAIADIVSRRPCRDVSWAALPWLGRADLSPAQRDVLIEIANNAHLNTDLWAQALLAPHHTTGHLTSILNAQWSYPSTFGSALTDAILDHPALTVADMEGLASGGCARVLTAVIASPVCTPVARATAFIRLQGFLTADPLAGHSRRTSLLGPVPRTDLDHLSQLHLSLTNPRLVYDIGQHLTRAGALTETHIDHILGHTPDVDADSATLYIAWRGLTELLCQRPNHPGVRATVAALAASCAAAIEAEEDTMTECPHCGYELTEVSRNCTESTHTGDTYENSERRTARLNLIGLPHTMPAAQAPAPTDCRVWLTALEIAPRVGPKVDTVVGLLELTETVLRPSPA